MIPTTGAPLRCFGLGTANYQTGESVVVAGVRTNRHHGSGSRAIVRRELFETIVSLGAATIDFSQRGNPPLPQVLSIIGSKFAPAI